MSIIIAPYEITVADTQERLTSVYRLRYQVYCQEKNFEPSQQHLPEQEKDNFDEQSIHILICDHKTKTPIATVRLIIACDANQPFHFESLSHQTFARVHDKQRSHFAEVSRLVVAKNYRSKTRHKLNQQQAQSTIPPLELIYLCLLIITDILNIESVCLLEPRFVKYLVRSGLKLTAIGEPFEHNGIRMPYVVCFKHLLRNQHRQLEQLYQALYQSLKTQVQQHPLTAKINKT